MAIAMVLTMTSVLGSVAVVVVVDSVKLSRMTVALTSPAVAASTERR